jgi:hypothetical protein
VKLATNSEIFVWLTNILKLFSSDSSEFGRFNALFTRLFETVDDDFQVDRFFVFGLKKKEHTLRRTERLKSVGTRSDSELIQICQKTLPELMCALKKELIVVSIH